MNQRAQIRKAIRSLVGLSLTGGMAMLLAGASQCSPDDGDCFFSDPGYFTSIEELECGLGPDGVSLCHWSLSFVNGEMQWMHSDVAEAGTYTCDGNTVTADTGYAVYSGEYDPATNVLVWEGYGYIPK